MTKHLHERRKITFIELGALLGTRALLAGKHLGHSKSTFARSKTHLFNMGVACARTECGTVSCIGGTVALIMGLDQIHNYVCHTRSESLHHLFFPPEGCLDWNSATPAVAVKAIDNWLKTGHPGWRKLLKRRSR